ncbi:uncharacterized protein LOC111620481 [Centruroides sculpturatus]|uniref:uncharacterized protein LOC111620481 n=1 Tax=Centruroides sculpturatus TaxID=218467 RepID=UPI000C6DC60F|nr:uncharacterized protein LOC111620481 [Centruroides sculpturatus]
MDNIWERQDITISTKARLVQAIVFPITTYGCESWTVRKSDRRRIDAFELWCWRQILRIPWTARTTNKAVLDKIRPQISLEAKLIARLRLKFFGHTIHANSLEKQIILRMVEGHRGKAMHQVDG